ncbi:MAG TPA: DUF1572 family protein [Chitinophagaceae bacterium]|nr:DUF1572 family protein [Chitinophagaceae bacterium]
MSLAKEYLDTVIKRLQYYKSLGDKTFAQMEEVDFYYQPNEASNSVAIIIQHMYGNMLSRWTNFLTEDGEKEWRERDKEFEVQSYSKEQLLDLWEKGWECFIGALSSLKKKHLKKMVSIRDEKLSVVDAINRQVAHYSYHIGQIVYVARMIKNENWKSLSIPKGASDDYNKADGIKDPAKSF